MIDWRHIQAPRFGLGAVNQRDAPDWLCVEAPVGGEEVLIPIPDGETALGFGRTWFRDAAHRRWIMGAENPVDG